MSVGIMGASVQVMNQGKLSLFLQIMGSGVGAAVMANEETADGFKVQRGMIVDLSNATNPVNGVNQTIALILFTQEQFIPKTANGDPAAIVDLPGVVAGILVASGQKRNPSDLFYVNDTVTLHLSKQSASEVPTEQVTNGTLTVGGDTTSTADYSGTVAPGCSLLSWVI